MTDEKHAVYPPSAGKRWIACPGSITCIPPGTDEGIPSSYAREGTMCHEIAAVCLKENKRAEAHIGYMAGELTFTQDLADAVQMYVDEVKSIAADMQVKGGVIEKTVHITEDCWGTLDCGMWNSDVLSVIDAKFGRGVIVEAEENPQMMIYAIGMLKQMKADELPIPPSVRMIIIQPRTVNPVREFVMSTSDLQRWAKSVLGPALERLRTGDTTCTAGGHCQWCAVGELGCAVQAESALITAAMAFEPFTGAKAPEIPQIATGGDPVMDLELQAALALSFPFIEEWMKSVRARLTALALEGKDIPFFKLVEGRSVRKWAKEEDETVEALREMGINPYEESLKTPPAVEKELGKKKAKEVNLEELIVKPKGSPTLVPETDKRSVMSINVEKQFEEFVDAPILVVGEDPLETPSPKSLLQRLAGRVANPVEEEEGVAPPEPVTEIRESRKVKNNVTIPKAPKRLEVFEYITTNQDAGVTLAQVTEALGLTERAVIMHLRYLNERDGYGYVVYQNDTITIFTE